MVGARREAAWTVVVPLQSLVNIARVADVVSIRISVAAEDVHEALSDSLHTKKQGTDRSSKKIERFSLFGDVECGFCERATARQPSRIGVSRELGLRRN